MNRRRFLSLFGFAAVAPVALAARVLPLIGEALERRTPGPEKSIKDYKQVFMPDEHFFQYYISDELIP